jgi:anti-anti-sigma factor
VTEDVRERLSGRADADPRFSVRTRAGGPDHVVALAGELDVASRDVAIEACAPGDHLEVHVDLSGLTFMDCAGYGALAVAASILERRGGSLVLLNAAGSPRRLLELIEAHDERLCAPLRFVPPLETPVDADGPGAPCSTAGRGRRRQPGWWQPLSMAPTRALLIGAVGAGRGSGREHDTGRGMRRLPMLANAAIPWVVVAGIAAVTWWLEPS